MAISTTEQQRLIVVSNRLPFVFRKTGGGWTAEPGAGGLVTAMVPILERRGGLWIGWPGTTASEAEELKDEIPQATADANYQVVPVPLTEREKKGFYEGFANEVLWPLFHDLQTRCVFEPEYWETYQQVNRKYAEFVAEHVEPGDFIWAQDYHLMCLGKELRELGVDNKIGFFLHTPFAAAEIYHKLPWREAILEAMLAYNIVGFQTRRDRRSFEQCLRELVANVGIRGDRRRVKRAVTADSDREVKLGVFPISIDVAHFEQLAQTTNVESKMEGLRREYPDRTLVLGVDRLDYTKGIPERLRAFREALERYPELRGDVSLIQIAVPSRESISEYRELRAEIARLVSEINGQYTRAGWVPIHYLFRQLNREDLVATYRASDVALVTSLKDGMNLISKEYCTSRVNDDGVLILSEFAGSASQLQHDALAINPYDRTGTADAIYEACHMSWDEQNRRMKRLRAIIRRHDIHWWVEAFLRATQDDPTHS